MSSPYIGQIAILFIVSDFVNSPVRGDLHEGQNHQPSGMRSAMCSKGVIYVVHLCDSASVVQSKQGGVLCPKAGNGHSEESPP